MSTNAYIPSFYFYKFANAVSAPYTSLSAYNSGLIDEQGNITGNESSIDEFEYFVIKLKKIFEQLPPGLTKARLTSIVGISQLFSEDFENIGVTEEQVVALIEAHVTNNSEGELSFIELMEDMGVGTVGGEISVPAEAPEANKGNVSGYDPKLGEIMTRSAPVNMFQGIEMFNVSPQEFKRFKESKAWKTVPNSPTKKYLQRFQRRNKEGKMAVREESSGEIFFVPYKEKSFMEEFNLEGLSILSEQRDFRDLDAVESEFKKLRFYEPVDINKKVMTDILRQANDNVENAIKTPGRSTGIKRGGLLGNVTAERIAQTQAIIGSAHELYSLGTSPNPSHRRAASMAAGGMKATGLRDPASTDNYDLVVLGTDPEDSSPTIIMADNKTYRATAPTPVKKIDLDTMGFPRIDDTNVLSAYEEAKKLGDTARKTEVREFIKGQEKDPKIQKEYKGLIGKKIEKQGIPYTIISRLGQIGRLSTPPEVLGALRKQNITARLGLGLGTTSSGKWQHRPVVSTDQEIGKWDLGSSGKVLMPQDPTPSDMSTWGDLFDRDELNRTLKLILTTRS
jgi:hypothetical protein